MKKKTHVACFFGHQFLFDFPLKSLFSPTLVLLAVHFFVCVWFWMFAQAKWMQFEPFQCAEPSKPASCSLYMHVYFYWFSSALKQLESCVTSTAVGVSEVSVWLFFCCCFFFRCNNYWVHKQTQCLTVSWVSLLCLGGLWSHLYYFKRFSTSTV